MEKSEMQRRHVLFQEEDKDSYVGTLLTARRRDVLTTANVV